MQAEINRLIHPQKKAQVAAVVPPPVPAALLVAEFDPSKLLASEI